MQEQEQQFISSFVHPPKMNQTPPLEPTRVDSTSSLSLALVQKSTTTMGVEEVNSSQNNSFTAGHDTTNIATTTTSSSNNSTCILMKGDNDVSNHQSSLLSSSLSNSELLNSNELVNNTNSTTTSSNSSIKSHIGTPEPIDESTSSFRRCNFLIQQLLYRIQPSSESEKHRKEVFDIISAVLELASLKVNIIHLSILFNEFYNRHIYMDQLHLKHIYLMEILI